MGTVHRIPVNALLITGALFAVLGTAGGQTMAGGNAERVAAIFAAKGGCVSSHRVRDNSSRLGPDLTEIGNTRQPDDLRKTILDPSPEVQAPEPHIPRRYQRRNRRLGKLLNQGATSVQMLDSKESLVSFQKSSLAEYKFVDTTPMPSYRNRLSSGEVEHVVAYLAQLKGALQ
jgi:putative heme-binding domain-containing protein